ncbi:hypothetical protein LINGRAHAP2_LOCUS11696 [Linum grandiflorum]
MMRKTKQAIAPAAAAVDRISELPDEIINLIVQSLQYQEAARTSILSRRWLNLWLANSVVEFQGDTDRFDSFAAATLKRLRAVPLLLDSFTISVLHKEDLGEEFHQLLLSASIVIDEDDDGSDSRSPLKVVLKISEGSSYSFEGRMLLNFGRTKFIDLEGFDLGRLHNFTTCLDNLQELRMEDVQVSQQSFPSCLANARRLEKLSLIFIRGIYSLDISQIYVDNLQELCLEHLWVSKQSFPSCLANARRLEKLSLRYIYGIDRLDISASDFPSLKSLSLQADEGELRELQLSSAPLLRTFRFVGNTKLLTVVSAPNVTSVELVAISPELTRAEFLELISKFPSLESLDFDAQYISSDYNRHHDKLSISAHTLRTLTLTKDQRKFEFEIDAPNLYINEQMERNFHRCCCGDDKCWRCEFRNAEITSVIVDDISTIDKPMTSQPSINMILKMPSDLLCS